MTEPWTIGLDIGGTNIKAGLVDRFGAVVRQDIVPTEARYGRDRILHNMISVIEQYRQYADACGVPLDGIGVGSAGQVNACSGTIAGATDNLPGWEGLGLRQVVEAASGLKVHVENDVNAIAAGEGWLGAGQIWTDYLCVALGTGVGGCLIVNGKPFYGRDGYAGEYGHQVVVRGGLPCTCGNRGCWEQYASLPALMRLIRSAYPEWSAGESGELPSPPQLFARAREGDGRAAEVIGQYADHIAVGLANLIHLFNPPTIILAGAIAQQGEYFLERIRSNVGPKLMRVFSASPPVPIVAASLGEQAGIIGAVKLFREFREA